MCRAHMRLKCKGYQYCGVRELFSITVIWTLVYLSHLRELICDVKHPFITVAPVFLWRTRCNFAACLSGLFSPEFPLEYIIRTNKRKAVVRVRCNFVSPRAISPDKYITSSDVDWLSGPSSFTRSRESRGLFTPRINNRMHRTVQAFK